MTALSQRVSNFWLMKLPFGSRLTIRPMLRIRPCPVPEKHKVLLSVPPSAGWEDRNHTRANISYLPMAADSQLQLLTLRPSYTLPARSCKSFGEASVCTSSESIFGGCLPPVVHRAKNERQLQDLTAGNLSGQTSTHKQ